MAGSGYVSHEWVHRMGSSGAVVGPGGGVGKRIPTVADRSGRGQERSGAGAAAAVDTEQPGPPERNGRAGGRVVVSAACSGRPSPLLCVSRREFQPARGAGSCCRAAPRRGVGGVGGCARFAAAARSPSGWARAGGPRGAGGTKRASRTPGQHGMRVAAGIRPRVAAIGSCRAGAGPAGIGQAGAVLSRSTTSPDTFRTRSRPAALPMVKATACSPMAGSGNRTVVNAGWWSRNVGMSSKPATCASRGTSRPASRSAVIAPRAITSLTAKKHTGPGCRRQRLAIAHQGRGVPAVPGERVVQHRARLPAVPGQRGAEPGGPVGRGDQPVRPAEHHELPQTPCDQGVGQRGGGPPGVRDDGAGPGDRLADHREPTAVDLVTGQRRRSAGRRCRPRPGSPTGSRP